MAHVDNQEWCLIYSCNPRVGEAEPAGSLKVLGQPASSVW